MAGMHTVAASSLWDPIGGQIPVAEMADRLAVIDRNGQGSMSAPADKSGSWLAFFILGGALFIVGSSFPALFSGINNSIFQFFAALSPWLLGLPFIAYAFLLPRREARKTRAFERVMKLLYARNKGWVMRPENFNRFELLNAEFADFMQAPGHSPQINEEWWGTWTSGGREYPVWLAELQYLATSGRYPTVRFSSVVGIRVRPSAQVPVSMVPESPIQKMKHALDGKYKTGNAGFDAAFRVSGGAGQISAVLTPKFIAAIMEYRSDDLLWVHRERDMLLVHFMTFSSPLLALKMATGQSADTAASKLDVGMKELIEPVIALAEKAGL
jgi:hypothetical protein